LTISAYIAELCADLLAVYVTRRRRWRAANNNKTSRAICVHLLRRDTPEGVNQAKILAYFSLRLENIFFSTRHAV